MRQAIHKNVLDNTLRYLYYTFRNSKISVAIEFKHGGRTWRADTPEEAITLRKKLEAEDQMAFDQGEEPDWVSEQVWTPDTITSLLQSAGERQKEFLELLYEKDTVTGKEVMASLAIGPMALAGVLSGLSKQLKKMDLKPWDLYKVEVSWRGKEKTRTFRLSSHFHWAAEEIGWPENWRKKK